MKNKILIRNNNEINDKLKLFYKILKEKEFWVTVT